jgi:hypothetical protein
MNSHDLEAFAAVVETGSIVGASKRSARGRSGLVAQREARSDERGVRGTRHCVSRRHAALGAVIVGGAPERRPEASRLCAVVRIAGERAPDLGAKIKRVDRRVGSSEPQRTAGPHLRAERLVAHICR